VLNALELPGMRAGKDQLDVHLLVFQSSLSYTILRLSPFGGG
jgi:hypothetical protein